LIAALGIGFVDALPIFGSATVMIPWAIISACEGNITLGVSLINVTLGISLIVLLAIMAIVKQFLEPKVVARTDWNTSYFYTDCYVYRI